MSCDECPSEPNPTEAPVQAPTPPSGNGCCTLDYKTCVDWCGVTEETCGNCGNNDVGWIPDGAPTGNCAARWVGCQENPGSCCAGLTCQESGGWYSCTPTGNSAPTIPPNPTNPPQPNPTVAPVPPTTAPIPPTIAPVPPTMAPVPSNGCCSLDYKNCVGWCGNTEHSCNTCGNQEVIWLPNGAENDTCGERWVGCGQDNDNNHSGCCNGLTCQWRDGHDYFACLPGDGTPTPPNPTNPPQSSPTNAPQSSPVSQPTPGGVGDWISGKATYYGGNPNGNACGYNDLPQVSFPYGLSVAIGGDEFDDGYGCGACFEVTCEGPHGHNPGCFCADGEQKKVIVQATDQCPECDSTHLDLNTAAFASIVGEGVAGTCGVINTSFRRVSCDFNSNIKIRSKSGTSGFWYGLHVDDVAGYGAIQSVNLREASRRQNGQKAFDIECRKSDNASYWLCDRPNGRQIFPDLDVEIIDSAGRVLRTNSVITNLGGGQEFDFRKNFAPIPDGAPTPTTPVPPTTAPVVAPTQAPAPTTPFNGELLSTDKAMNAWDVYQGLEYITHKNSENPPNYALVASGGAAGGGNLVVSESQAYSLLITGTVLASWQTHAGQVSGANRNEVLKSFEGYFNFWKEMCKNSSGNPANCQPNGKFCKSGSDSFVCLPDWRHYKTGGSESTGPAPDADEDAIVGIILAVKAVENDANKPSWYDEARKWADASATAFYEYEVDKSKSDYRLVKLGSCWGGWENSGNNPSYHGPGAFRVMKDYQKSFPNSDRDGYSAVPQSDWQKLIDTSHEVMQAVQCSDDGAMVPNWATIGVSGGKIIHTGKWFSGSGTPQYEYGAEAARTTFRVALDAAFYPEKSDAWSPYLSSFNFRLDGSYNNGSFSSNTFPSCRGPNTSQDIHMFSGWLNNEFIFGPTVTALIGASSDIVNAQAMIDSAGQKLAGQLPGSYYPRSWAMISNLMLNGAMESAGETLKA